MRYGKIVSARAGFPFESNGFSIETWGPFVDFVDTTYPGDGGVMYTSEDRTDPQSTPESLRLSEQNISDYIASVNTNRRTRWAGRTHHSRGRRMPAPSVDTGKKPWRAGHCGYFLRPLVTRGRFRGSVFGGQS